MARRDVNTPRGRRPHPAPARSQYPRPDDDGGGDEGLARLGEILRRVSLGLLAFLFVTRAYAESEAAERGDGLVWVFLVLVVAGIAVASALLSGVVRLRWSWADGAVLVLMLAVGASTTVAADRRAAINLAWEWGALGLMYLMARNLPRTRGESATLAGVAVAAAVSVAAYGLYQVPFEYPALRALFLARPDLILGPLGIAPGSPAAEGIRQRILFSNEPFSTFALANSLAGYLVGPLALGLAVALDNLRRDGKGPRAGALALAAIPGSILLVCLVWTKCRSAQVGLMVAILVLAWRSRAVVSRKVLIGSALGLAVVAGGLIAGGVATGQLDRQVLTESPKSLRYRLEYWASTWDLITDARPRFGTSGAGAILPGGEESVPSRRAATYWTGVGPGNFGGAYLGHKRPEASEEIKDPHNLILEVWACSGLVAALALVVALGWGLREMLGPPREMDPANSNEMQAADPAPAPAHAGWLIGAASLGWLGVVLMGRLNPFQVGLLGRWLILGLGWVVAIGLGSPLWRRRPIPAAGLGVATLAMTINLLGAGGIGIPTVALMLWISMALGLNLRDDRPCGRHREADGLGAGVAMACVWAALAGTFYGAIVPFWRSTAELAAGDALMSVNPPQFEAARNAYTRAFQLDRYSVQPWLALADLEFRFWRSPEAANRKEPYWERILFSLDKALEAPDRDPNSLDVRRRQAMYARQILAALPADATPMQLLQLKSTIVKAMRRSVMTYPANAGLRVELARASADLGMYPDAVREAKLAIQLDGMMPHPDKKLAPATIAYLKAEIPRWEALAAAPPPTAADANRPAGARPGGAGPGR
ncbi:O-antigen ligase family protein [Tundrisphaera sp. TA3]|uniref:O-antigen ligase family protein n=1 Tax=Tundrisphaera sp. TA3 TaxID=3435775 RepID=UPI003EC09C8E